MDNLTLSPDDHYAHGQMMGILVVIRMIENARDTHTPIPASTFDKMSRIATESLAQYLQKPEEDVIMLVDNQLRSI